MLLPVSCLCLVTSSDPLSWWSRLHSCSTWQRLLPSLVVSTSRYWCTGEAGGSSKDPVDCWVASLITQIRNAYGNNTVLKPQLTDVSETMSFSTKPKMLLLSFIPKDWLAEFLVFSLSGRAVQTPEDFKKAACRHRTAGFMMAWILLLKVRRAS